MAEYILLLLLLIIIIIIDIANPRTLNSALHPCFAAGGLRAGSVAQAPALPRCARGEREMPTWSLQDPENAPRPTWLRRIQGGKGERTPADAA